MKHFKIEIATLKHRLVSIEDFGIEEGKITFLFGESGIGKTLIAQTLFGLTDPDRLRVLINGQNYYFYLRSEYLRRLQKQGFFVFQEPSTHLNPLMRLEEQLNEGSLSRLPDNRAVLESLWQAPFETEIKPLLRVYPKPFRPSGGEKQRFLLAMALKKMDLMASQNKALFIFDEPTRSLDNFYRNIFLKELLKRYRQYHQTILFITHDYSIISELEQQHSSLKSAIVLRELRRVEGFKVALFPFKAKYYLDWVNTLKPFPAQTKGTRQTVLQVESGFSVFGKRYAFFKNNGKRALPLKVERGTLTYLKAPSGLGKTTLAKIISGLQKADQVQFRLGALQFDQNSPLHLWKKQVWGKKLIMVFQHADEALNLKSTVRQTFSGLPMSKDLLQNKLPEILQAFFDQPISTSFLNKPVAFLSGGQKQRLNLLRTLLLQPDLIILDEPLNGLDFNSIKRVLELIEQRMTSGSGILLISHNEEIFDRLIAQKHIYYLKIVGSTTKKHH